MQLLIQDLKHAISGSFKIPARVMKIQQKAERTFITLADMSGTCTLLQSRQYEGAELTLNRPVMAQVSSLKLSGDNWFKCLMGATRLDDQQAGVRLIPRTLIYQPHSLIKLFSLTERIRHPALKRMVNGVLSCNQLYVPFVQIPASKQYHHAYPGGLLEHSVETAILLKRLDVLTGYEADLATVGALFHDIGKIKVFNCEGKRTRIGHVVDHENLTLEVLSPWLTKLEQLWPDGAIALRHIWTPARKYGTRYPDSHLRQLVRMADQLSTLLDRQKSSYAGVPAWQHHRRRSQTEHWWRP